MKKYRAIAKMQITLYLDLEAKDDNEAYQIAKDADGGNFIEFQNSGTWDLTDVVELHHEASY